MRKGQKRKNIVQKMRIIYHSSRWTHIDYRSIQDVYSPVPEVGKHYHFWDDGKVTMSRHYLAEVVRVIPMKHVRKKMRDLYWAWVHEAVRCDWVYEDKSDYAVCCKVEGYDDRLVWFFRRKHGGWFSIDWPAWWMSGELDVDNRIYESYRAVSEDWYKVDPDYLKEIESAEIQRKKLNADS